MKDLRPDQTDNTAISSRFLYEAKITAQDRDKKIIIFKFRRRKNYRRKTGHRQPFTAVLITGIRSGKN